MVCFQSSLILDQYFRITWKELIELCYEYYALQLDYLNSGVLAFVDLQWLAY